MRSLRYCVACLIALATCVLPAPAQTGKARLRYQFSPGTTLTYKLAHELTIENVVGGNKQHYTSRSQSTRVYRVLEVSSDWALLELTVTHLKVDATLPNGTRIQVDSATDKSHPLAKLAGQPILRLKVSSTGQISEVQRLRPNLQGIDATLQYSFIKLPQEAVAVGETWTTPFKFTLPPPLGSGRTVALVQRYRLAERNANLATVELATDFQDPDGTSPQIAAAAAQFLMSGSVLFDLSAGRIERTDYTIDRIVQRHVGDDSAMTVKGRLTQVLIHDIARSP